MKHLKLFMLLISLMILFGGTSQAGIYYFNPSPSDLYGLEHQKYYTWGIDWNHTDEYITEAVLTFYGIYDWRAEVDSLYIHLLDNPALGVTVGTDNQGGGDYFSGAGAYIDTWTDPNGGSRYKIDLSYSLAAEGVIGDLNSYASDGRFGFGFDPDCHYYNDEIELKVITSAVPEPGTLAIFGLGLSGLGLALRRKKYLKG